MSFGRQLLLLLWKNFTLRKRQKLRIVLEILFPLALFIILVLVRSRPGGLQEIKPECHFDGKAMPSAGALPFLQGVLCTATNKCYQKMRQDEVAGALQNFNTTLLSVFFSDFEKILNNNSQTQAITDLIYDFNVLRSFNTKVQNGTLQGTFTIGSFLVNPQGLQAQIQQQNISLTPEVIEAIENATIRPQETIKIIDDLLNVSSADIFNQIQTGNLNPVQAVGYLLQLQQSLSSFNFSILLNPDFVCNETYLNRILLFTNASQIHDVSQQLCNLTQDPAQFQLLLQDFQQQLDAQKLAQELIEFIELNAGQDTRVIRNWSKYATRLQNIQQDVTELESSYLLFSEILGTYLNASNGTSNSAMGFLSQLLCGREDVINISVPVSFGSLNQSGSAISSIITQAGQSITNSSVRTTKAGNSNGAPCHFPFKYKNKLYTACTGVPRNDGRKWCATTKDYDTDKKWSMCYDFCEDTLFAGLKGSAVGNALWRQIQPLILGYVPYYPNTTAVNRLIKQANGTFEEFARLKTLALDWMIASPRVRNFLATDPTVEVVRNILNSSNPLSANFPLPAGTQSIGAASNWTSNPLRMQLQDFLYNGPKIPGKYDWRDAMDSIDSASKTLEQVLGCFNFDKFMGFADKESLIKKSWELIDRGGNNLYWSALTFENIDLTKPDELPSHVSYKIRMDKNKVDSTSRTTDYYWRPGPRASVPGDTKYITYGFAYLQDMVEHAIIKLQTGTEEPTGVYTQQFPYPSYNYDKFAVAISRTMPLFMTLAWIYTVAMIVKGIVHEKEHRLKEVMKMMGLSNGIHWLAWFITSFVVMATTVLLLTILLKVGKVAPHSNPVIIFIFMICFTIATICQSFFFSIFFSKANLAAACGGILYFVFYLPYAMLVSYEEIMTASEKTLASLLSAVAFGTGCGFIWRFEEQGVGLQWSNIATSPNVDDDFTTLHTMIMMLVDSVILLLLTWYIEAVWPGEFGIPRPWYFPFTKSYWCGFEYNMDVDSSYELDNENIPMEREPTNLPMGVKIQKLRKVYKNGNKVAVDGLSVNFYENQITSFLGHNGAGKTTTMSILTGLFPPTGGTAYVYGADIRTRIETVRKSLGMCPQHNVLFDHLTVEEHLWFYARLKGMISSDIPQEMKQMIRDVGLPHKAKALSCNLSGGMKRKLSVAIAFCGGSKTVILDEPTAGIDPYARRAIWDLLLKFRKGRTIILSTHHMDEADILGDRIAIISQGKLCCVGSSMFLKNEYGSGYYLTLVKADDFDDEVERPASAASRRTLQDVKAQLLEDEGIDVKSDRSDRSDSDPPSKSPTPPLEEKVIFSSDLKITAFVEKFIPGANIVESSGTELCYQLPAEGSLDGSFQRLFESLDKNLIVLGISSYGISDTSLEEVFLRVANETGVDTEEGLRQRLEQVTEGGKFARPLTRLSFRTKLMTFFGKRKRGRTAIEDTEYLDTDTETDAGSLSSTSRTNSVSNLSTTEQGVTFEKVTGWALKRRQLRALVAKRFHHVRRSKKGFLAEIILPAGFVCLAMIFSTIVPTTLDQPPLELHPWLYTPKRGDPHLTTFYSNDKPGKAFPEKFQSLLTSSNLGTRCMDPNIYQIKGYPCETVKDWTTKWTKSPPLKGASNISYSLQETTDILANMTQYNISDWVVKSMYPYIKRRYGGVSFGDQNQLVDLNSSSLYDVLERISTAINNGAPVFNGTTRDSIWNTMDQFVQGLETQHNVKVWYNNKGWAAMVSYMNAVNNVILRARLPSGKDPKQYGITAWNHPMSLTEAQFSAEQLKKQWVSVLVAICVIFAMSFIPASFVLYLIEERTTNSKHLQMVSGVSPTIYWITNFIWDFLNYLIPAILCVFIFLAFDQQAYVSSTNAPCLILLLVLYGWATIPMMFPFCWVFNIPSTAFVSLSCINVFLGMVSTIATFTLQILDDQELTAINDILRQVFLLLPHYCLGRGLIDMATGEVLASAALTYGVKIEFDPFEWKNVGRNLFCLFIEGIVFFILTLLFQYRFFIKPSHVTPPKTGTSAEEDEDVSRERRRVLDGAATGDILRLENLTKVYKSNRTKSADVQFPGFCACVKLLNWLVIKFKSLFGMKRTFVAVDRLCVGIPKGECFGLLGVNGAGKTTTFKMLTGDIPVTKGNAHLNNYSILSDMVSVHQSLGYCPQFDAIDPLITGKETLEFYARLRGVQEKDLTRIVDQGIRKLGLIQYANKLAGDYSGGNKRKLSTAISMIGDPPVIFLDEPTTGMDPKARRFLWKCIQNIIKDGRSLILTSHSMEECEALCGRIAIMVNGQFKCIGSVQHLKNRFGDGYSVILRLEGQTPDLEPVMKHMLSLYPNLVVKETHHNMVEYQLPSEGLSLSCLFGELFDMKDKYKIEDYSVSQTTLDQVFINFAKLQTDLEDVGVDHELMDDGNVVINMNEIAEDERRTNNRRQPDFDEVSQTGSTIELLRSNSSRSICSINTSNSYLDVRPESARSSRDMPTVENC